MGERPDSADRLATFADALTKRGRLKDIATVLATLVTIGFFGFVGYCVWLFMHETHLHL